MTAVDQAAKHWTAIIGVGNPDALAIIVRVTLDAAGKPTAVDLDAGPPNPHSPDGSPWTYPAHVSFRDLGKSITVGLQNGVPLFAYTKGLQDARFAPAGRTNDPLVPMCRSAVDYVARSLQARFPGT